MEPTPISEMLKINNKTVALVLVCFNNALMRTKFMNTIASPNNP